MYFRHICKWLLQSHNYKNIHLAAHFYSPLQLATAGSVISFLLNLAFHLLSRIFFKHFKGVWGGMFPVTTCAKARTTKKKRKKKMKKNRILTSTSSTTCSLVGYKPLRVGHASPGGKYNWNFSITNNTKSAVKYFPIVYIYSLCLCFKYCLF